MSPANLTSSLDTIQVDRPNYQAHNPIHQIAPRGLPNDNPRMHDKDPSQETPGIPPNYGDFVLPHVTTFQGVVSTISRVYRPSDEAIKDSFDNARFMLNDLTVTESLEQRQRSTALLDWHLEPEDEADKEAQWVCDNLTPIVQRIPRFVQYRENLLRAIWYGKYAISNQYRWDMVRGKKRMVLSDWLPVHGDKLVFRYDDGSYVYDPNQVGIRVGAGYTTVENVATRWDDDRHRKVEATDWGLAYFLDPWEREFLTIHKHQIEDGEYEEPTHAGRIHGLGIRSKIYWTWYQKQEALAFLMEFLERSAFGIEIWYYPWGNAQAEAKTREAAQERIGPGRNVVLVPRPLGEEGQSYGVEHIEPGMAGAETLKDILVNYFGHLIKRYILGQTLTTEADATGLGGNLASVHLDTYLQIIRYDAINLQESITKDLIDVLVKHNFPQYRNNKVKFVIETEAPDVEAKLAAWRQAFDMGLKLKANDVYELIAAEEPAEGEDALENPQVGEAAAQQQQMQAQQGMEQQRMQMDQENAQFEREQAVEQSEYQREQDRQEVERNMLLDETGGMGQFSQEAGGRPPVERYDEGTPFCGHCGGKKDVDTGERVPMCKSDDPRSGVEEYGKSKDSPGQKTMWDEDAVNREPGGKSEGGQFTSSGGGTSKEPDDEPKSTDAPAEPPASEEGGQPEAGSSAPAAKEEVKRVIQPLEATKITSVLRKTGMRGSVRRARDPISGFKVSRIGRKHTFMVAWEDWGGTGEDHQEQSEKMEAALKEAGFEVKRPYPDKTLLGVYRVKQSYARQTAQFQRHYYNLASEPQEAAWWASSEPGEIRALTPTGPVRYVKHASGGFSAEPIQ